MRILHVINNLNTGGAEKLLLDTIPIFNKKGFNVDLLLLDGQEYPYLTQLKKLNCCTIYSLNSKNIYNPINTFRIISYIKNYDLIHVHLFPAQYWVAIAKMISLSKCKIIFTEHNTTNRRMQNVFFKYIERYIYKIYDKVVCISAEIWDILVNYSGLNSDKFIIIKNGINIELFENATRIKWSKINPQILDSDLVIIQIAGFRLQKNQKTTISALPFLDSNIKLVLVGDGERRAELENFVNDLNLKDRVIFLGVRLDVPNLLKSSYISIVSSHWEGMPLSVIEGMAVNIPVIASNVPGVTQLVDNVGVLFENGDVQQLAKIINQLISDDAYYRKVAKTCHEYSKEFDVLKMIDSTLSLYQNVLRQG